jgi:NAD-dependent SIR2 family protein deacetylase
VAKEKLDALAEKVAELIVNAKKLVVFTGAGVSTESGIPDFRSPGGIWERFDPDDFTYQKFVADPEARRKQWQMLGEGHLTTEAKPNPAHYAIAELDKMGRLDCVITQNVDNLHQKAGVPAYAVQAGAKLVIVNLSSTPMDGEATVLINAKAGEALSRIVDKVRERQKID